MNEENYTLSLQQQQQQQQQPIPRDDAGDAAAVARTLAATAAAPFWMRWVGGLTPAAIQQAAPQPSASLTLALAGAPHDNLPAQTARSDRRTSTTTADKAGTAVDSITGRFKPARFQSNNQHRLFLMRHAARLLAIERRNADATVKAPTRFVAAMAPQRPQGPHPHIYQSLHEDPLPLLGPRSAVQMAYLERMRAVEATAGPGALLPADLDQRVQRLVAGAGAPAAASIPTTN